VFGICVKTGIFKMHVIFSRMGAEHLRHQFNHLFDNISEGDIKGFVFQHNSQVQGSGQTCVRNFSRFRLRAHHLRVESCKWHGGSSICDKCECGEVRDEKHVLFFCKCVEVCELRMRYRDLFEGMLKTLRVFAPSSSEFIFS
jgi:hypothetical protein